jgi:predicted nucleotide-binding protein
MPSEIIYNVFVSSTYEDLREERAAVQKALLQLHCVPTGMELFGSADEETWEFIKRQIEDCDYYVVIVADKYGSTAEDGVSYTEKEYDYARKVKKPILAFVHSDRQSIRRDKIETDPENRPKLEAFIQKIRRSPVSFFTAPHDLATQVTVSFVNLRDRHPAVGFIRADRAADIKRYIEVLEEKDALTRTLDELTSPFAPKVHPDTISGHAKAERPTTVFLVHGHDEGALHMIARFIERLGLQVIILHERVNRGRTIITKFQEEAAGVGFAIVLMTPDDFGGANSAADQKPRARQNVVFELGFFIGVLGPQRVAAVVKGNLELPSDLDGIVYISLDRGDWQIELGRELQSAGFVVNWNQAMRA